MCQICNLAGYAFGRVVLMKNKRRQLKRRATIAAMGVGKLQTRKVFKNFQRWFEDKKLLFLITQAIYHAFCTNKNVQKLDIDMAISNCDYFSGEF